MESILGKCSLHHIGCVVKDMEYSKTNYARLVGEEVPATVVSDQYETMGTIYRGNRAPYTGLQQTSFVKDGQTVEFIMPNEGPSEWNDYLAKHGEGLHHLCFLVENLEMAVKNCESSGMKLIQSGNFPGGRYVYMDGKPFLCVCIELLAYEAK